MAPICSDASRPTPTCGSTLEPTRDRGPKQALPISGGDGIPLEGRPRSSVSAEICHWVARFLRRPGRGSSSDAHHPPARAASFAGFAPYRSIDADARREGSG